MSERLSENSGRHRWVVFVCGVICIAAVGVSAHFFGREKEERDRRIAAEGRLKTLSSELRLLEEKNRELAEQLREAKKLAEELAREREKAMVARAETMPPSDASRTEPAAEEPAAQTPGETATAPSETTVPGVTSAVTEPPLNKLATAAGKVRDAAGAGWRTVGGMIAASLNPARRQAKAASGSEAPETEPQKTNASEANEGSTVSGFSRAMAEARRSAREAFGQMRSMFSIKTAPPAAAASAQVSALTTPSAPISTPAAAPLPVSPAPESPTKLTATNEELRAELEEVRKEKRDLEKQIAERTGKIDGAVNVGQVNITTGRRFSGKVLVVNQKHKFVVIDIGKNQGLEKDTVLIVHRENQFIGKAQVIKVYEKMAAADLVMDWMQGEVQVNDGVKKF
jgi:hypothetical protein